MKKTNLVRRTTSICPVCLKTINAEIVEEDENIVLKKKCNQHGTFSALHWQSPKLFHAVEKCNYLEYPGTKFTAPPNNSCSGDCESCSEHASKTVVAVLDVTNKCDLKCPVCFAGAPSNNGDDDPSLDEIYRMLKFLRGLEVAPPTVLLSGGEPLIRNDMKEIVRMAHTLRFMTILATNGLRIAENPELAKELKQAGLNIVYLQFDGVTNPPYEMLRGARLLREKRKVIEACRNCNLEVILVPTLAQGINDSEIGDIIRFAGQNADIIRGVVFQPISFTGRNSLSRKRNNAVMSRFVEETERQTNGEIKAEDLFPVSIMVPPIRLMRRFMEKPWPLFSNSPTCGVANWVLVSKGQEKTLTPINHLLKFDSFMSHLTSIADDIERKKIGKIRIYIKLILATMRSIDWKKTQETVGLLTTIRTIFRMHISPSYASLADIRRRILLVGCMAFMDQYNFDMNRARNCVIQYITSDLKLVPFCVFNNLYRPRKARKNSADSGVKFPQRLPAIS